MLGTGVWRVGPGETDTLAARAAGALVRSGAQRGDRVVLSGPTSPALLAAVVGALRAGIVPVVLNPSLTEAERGAIVADAAPRLVVTGRPALDGLVAGDGAPVDLADVPLGRPMHYTSGTSGRPKGVWAGVLEEADARAMYEDEADTWGLGAGDVLLVCSPLHHSAPVRFAVSTLLRGGDVVLVAPFDAVAVADAIEQHRPTVAFVVPSHLQRLFALPPERLPDVASFRVLALAGEPCAEDV